MKAAPSNPANPRAGNSLLPVGSWHLTAAPGGPQSSPASVRIGETSESCISAFGTGGAGAVTHRTSIGLSRS